MEEKIKNFLKQLRLNESMVSTGLGVVVVLTVGVLLYNFFTKRPAEAPVLDDGTTLEVKATPMPVQPGEVNVGEVPVRLPKTHRVVRGENLWRISETYYGSGYNFVDVALANELQNANYLEEGQELMIPEAPAKKQTIADTTVTVVAADAMSISGGTYTTSSGDSLWTVAVRAYGDGYQWVKLYDANRDQIGINPNLIEKGVELLIPRS